MPALISDVINKSNLQPKCAVEFQLNLGTTLDTVIDITKFIVNLGDVSEKLTQSSTITGGVLLPKMNIKLDNSRGSWNKLGKYFKSGYVNNSIIKITTRYVTSDGDTITPAYVYRGIIKYIYSTWDRENFIFETVLTPTSSLIATEKVAPGILSNNTFKNICYKILNRTPFTKYMTIDLINFEMGWDIAVTDSIADMQNEKVKTVLDKIMMLTGSVYYINYSQNFIIEPITPSSPASVWTLRGHDIFKITSEEFDWKSNFTGIKWDDGENTVQRVEMNYPDRELYQYDYTELKLTNKYITNSTDRTTILNNLLSLYKFLKRKVKLTCKWNPEVLVNKYVTIDIPSEAIIGEEYMIWNKDQWNEGKFWGLAQQGISFSSSNLWRVLDIKRQVEGEKMQLTLVQLYSDDAR